MPIRRLTLFDITVDLIPGGLLIIILLSIPPTNDLLTFSGIFGVGDGSIQIAIFLLLSYVVGQLLQTTIGRGRSDQVARIFDILLPGQNPDRDPPFEQALRQRFEHSPRTTQIFVDGCREKFGISVSEGRGINETLNHNNLEQLYWLLRNYLADKGGGQTERYLILRTFFRSVWAVLIVGSILYITYAAFLGVEYGRSTGNTLSQPIGYGLLGVIAFCGAVLAHKRRRGYDRDMGETMIDEFYTTAVVGSDSLTVPDISAERVPKPEGESAVTEEGYLRMWPVNELEGLADAIKSVPLEQLENGEDPDRTNAVLLHLSSVVLLIDLSTSQLIEEIMNQNGNSDLYVLLPDVLRDEPMEDVSRDKIREHLSVEERIEILAESGYITSGQKGNILDAWSIKSFFNLESDEAALFEESNVDTIHAKLGSANTAVKVLVGVLNDLQDEES